MQDTSAPVKGRLLDQHKLLLSVIHAPWANALDIRVAAVVIEMYFKKYGTSRVALRYIEQAIGRKRSRTDIATSLRRLIEHGVISVASHGTGTRPTEYVPNFLAVTETVTATDDNSQMLAVSESDTSEVSETVTTSDASGVGFRDQNLTYSSGLGPEEEEGTCASAQVIPWPARGLTPALGQGRAMADLLAIYRRPYGEDAVAVQAALKSALTKGTPLAAILDGARAWVAARPAEKLPKLEQWLERGLWQNDPPAKQSHRIGAKPRRRDATQVALLANGYVEDEDGAIVWEGGR
jgi:hypothetical protein